jgi:anti-sigma B factor antagonist
MTIPGLETIAHVAAPAVSAVALVLAARFTWRAFALASDGEAAGSGPIGPKFALERAMARPAPRDRERSPDAQPGRRPTAPSPASPIDGGPRAVQPAAQASRLPQNVEVLLKLRARMDEVSYAAGSPNVLAMTKYVGEAREADAGEAPAPPPAPPVDTVRLARSDDGDRTVLTFSGTLDALSAPGLGPHLDAVVEQKRPTVVLDLAGLEMIDSSGVGCLVSILRRARAYGGAVRVRGLRGQPLSIFKLIRFDRLFTLE